ncbi:MAG: hypothetical protein JST82_03140 [Bacteroidetes bacterium]|nr:hypothetical protein [Bacteroidota bacterium]
MKKLSSIMALLAIFFMPLTRNYASTPGTITITGFWLDVATVNSMANVGATNLKIFAATDDAGNNVYVMIGTDAAGNAVGSQAFMSSTRGVCPPSCEFSSMAVNGNNVEMSMAQGYVDKYMNANESAKNCAKFTMSSLSTIRTNNTYIKVTIGSTATAVGYKNDGASTKGTASGTASTEGM